MGFYACFDPVSRVCVQAGMCSDGEEGTQRIGTIVIPTDALIDIGASYTDGFNVQVKPDKPSPYHRWENDSWLLPSDALSSAKSQGALAIDNAAGRARSRHITTVPGQGETYTAKYQEALDYIAAGYSADLTQYPFIAGESQPNTWMTPTQAATRIATLGGYWREVIGPAIEAARINGKDAMDAITDPAAIDAHVASVVATLDAI